MKSWAAHRALENRSWRIVPASVVPPAFASEGLAYFELTAFASHDPRSRAKSRGEERAVLRRDERKRSCYTARTYLVVQKVNEQREKLVVKILKVALNPDFYGVAEAD